MLWVIGGLLLFYLITVTGVLWGIHRMRPPVKRQRWPFVSIVVAARNEESTIRACLESLAAQDYPADQYEILVVNDRSTDRTGAILESLAKRMPHLIVFHLGEEALPGLTGKQRALAYAYPKCRGELILNTDADCLLPRGWVRSLVSAFHPDTGLVIGVPTCHVRGTSAPFFGKLQSLDLVHLLGYAIGAAGWQRTTSCIGNNMAYRRAAVEELGGLVTLPDTVTEDALLAQAIEYRTNWRVDAALLPEAVVLTQPARNWREFYRQRKRWLVGGIATRRPEVAWLYGLYLFHVLALLLPFFGWLISPGWSLGGWAMLLGKLIADASVCLTMTRRLGRWDLMKYFLPYEAFLIIYSVVVGAGALVSRQVVWKGHRYGR